MAFSKAAAPGKMERVKASPRAPLSRVASGRQGRDRDSEGSALDEGCLSPLRCSGTGPRGVPGGTCGSRYRHRYSLPNTPAPPKSVREPELQEGRFPCHRTGGIGNRLAADVPANDE